MSHTENVLDTRALAEHLVAMEAASGDIAEADTLAICRVCEKLRRPLVVLIGTAGFASLLSRSLTLAKRQVPTLDPVQVKPDGTLDGFVPEAAEAEPTLVGCLLSLLRTFIGGALTMRILNDVWPGKLDDLSHLANYSEAEH